MRDLLEKFKKWHEKTPEKWKQAVIEKADDNICYIDKDLPIDWLYDDCIGYLFLNSTIKIKNLAKKLGYKKIPCMHCRNIIKYWDRRKEVGYIWSPDTEHLFKEDKQ